MAELKEGILVHPRIIVRRFPGIEHGPLPTVRAIVVHQTDASTAESTFQTYVRGPNGAHFLIDKGGLVFQTARLDMQCWHVGHLIKSRCLELRIEQCGDAKLASLLTLVGIKQFQAIDGHERQKAYPARFPVNADSIGVELVGRSLSNVRYEAVTLLQEDSLRWLVAELGLAFAIGARDVYRHPEVSYKNPGEARSAKWK